MKKIMLLIIFVSFSAFAFEMDEPKDDVSTQLCNFWRYNFDIRNYVCSSTGRYVTLVEAREFRRTIEGLQGQIRELERKIESLNGTEK